MAGSPLEYGYQYSRSVTVPSGKPSHFAGDDVVTVTMLTGGLCKPDGSDIRVMTHDGKLCPMRLLMVGPGDQVSLAFALQPGVAAYRIYMSPAKEPPAPQKLDIKRGVLLETWSYEGGGIRTVEMVKDALQKSATFVGRGFRPNIFNGHNPFGPENRIINVFTAYLLAPKDGEYLFGTSSHDASFMLVDGNLVVDFGGFHDVKAEVRAQGKVQLKAGVHELTYYHVNGGGDPICVAAWKPPGADKIWTIGSDSFTPVIGGTVGPIEQYGRSITVDYTATQLGEAFVQDRYYQRYSFEAAATGAPVRSFQWTWDFGDGQVGKGESVDHVYLLSGQYTVTLKSTGGGAPMKRTNRIFVARVWDRVISNDLDSMQTQANIVSEYDYSALDAKAVAEAVVLLDRCERLDAIIAAGDALMKKTKVPPEALDTTMPIYSQTLAKKNQRPKAVAALLAAAKMTDNVATQATVMSLAGAAHADRRQGRTDEGAGPVRPGGAQVRRADDRARDSPGEDRHGRRVAPAGRPGQGPRGLHAGPHEIRQRVDQQRRLQGRLREARRGLPPQQELHRRPRLPGPVGGGLPAGQARGLLVAAQGPPGHGRRQARRGCRRGVGPGERQSRLQLCRTTADDAGRRVQQAQGPRPRKRRWR